MIYLKIIFGITLIALSVSPLKSKEFFTPTLIIYLVISMVVFYQISVRVFIAGYSAVEVQTEEGEQTLELSKFYILILLALLLMYVLPVFTFLSRVRSSTVIVVILLSISILPDLAQQYVWKTLFVKVY